MRIAYEVRKYGTSLVILYIKHIVPSTELLYLERGTLLFFTQTIPKRLYQKRLNNGIVTDCVVTKKGIIIIDNKNETAIVKYNIRKERNYIEIIIIIIE